MKELFKLYLEYKGKRDKYRLIARALDQRKWIMKQRSEVEGVKIGEIDLIINKILKANIH